MKWGFAKKVIIKTQRQVMFSSNFYVSDVTKIKFPILKIHRTYFQHGLVLSIKYQNGILNLRSLWYIDVNSCMYCIGSIDRQLELTRLSLSIIDWVVFKFLVLQKLHTLLFHCIVIDILNLWKTIIKSFISIGIFLYRLLNFLQYPTKRSQLSDISKEL